MRQEALARIELAFNILDADNSGNLEEKDFQLLATRFIAAVPDSADSAKDAMVRACQSYWDTLQRELDANNDGKITPDEYTASVDSPERFEAVIAQFARAIVTLGDLDGDGLVERPQFVALIRAAGVQLANINAMFEALAPQSEHIRAESWIAAINESFRPDAAGVASDQLVGTVLA